MKLIFLITGILLQGVALYVAFYTELRGNIYLATIVSVLSICCLISVRSLIAPASMMAGILIGLSLSHNESDLKFLNHLESSVYAAFAPVLSVQQNVEPIKSLDFSSIEKK
ncbi:hypothetical protein [Photobacterium lipolyticum]|uniref:Uncharacterized protein n=1 Tax=Photobacterium lipolyticum TaxID=266810 RepID=A0A2T3N1R2_9GAMM|nr:hypothetical protein [Photobacterium lipolyticum]PSW06211.1 hypothetical protein C9I89_06805 [Photobacterium lipolyticum]